MRKSPHTLSTTPTPTPAPVTVSTTISDSGIVTGIVVVVAGVVVVAILARSGFLFFFGLLRFRVNDSISFVASIDFNFFVTFLCDFTTFFFISFVFVDIGN